MIAGGGFAGSDRDSGAMLYIPGCAGKYAATRDGKIWSFKTKRRRWGKWLKKCVNSFGYETVSIFMNGRSRTTLVHRLIAITYLPSVEGKDCVNHKNGIKTDNRVENLEWCDYSENTEHAISIGLRSRVIKREYKRTVRL